MSQTRSINPSAHPNDSESDKGNLVISLARNQFEIEEAQRLRYKIFSEELGAKIGKNDIDVDGFDEFCDHLIIRDQLSQRVVGTYRILTAAMAAEAGGFYSAGEFDLSRLQHLFNNTIEVGRACVHPDYRHGGTIALLWSGIAKYMKQHGYEYMIGCASIPMTDGGHIAASIYEKLVMQGHLCPQEYRVFPHCSLPLNALNTTLDVSPPALLKGYMRIGAYICGEPAWDPYFNTADLLVMLPMSRIHPRYAAHFLK
jgi:putative hemolysin